MAMFICLILVVHALVQKIGTELTGTEQPAVNIKQGRALGKVLTSTSGKEFLAFLGIPYGKVIQRFKSPEPADPWTGVFNATIDGSPCKQDDVFAGRGILGQEDCLVINVYTPRNVNKNLPVMFFLYGGGFMAGEGTSTVYGPEKLMNKDIILAVPNYRVGAFGFLSTGDEASPGNYGLLDQVLALTWVKNNIESFGGDPNKVTLFGESAGAASVTFHLLSPLSKGLFHAAIAHSGSATASWAVMKDPLKSAKRMAQNLDCPTKTTAELVTCLIKVDADDLVRAANISLIEGTLPFLNGPVVENPSYGKFLTEDPLKLLEEGRFNKVPFISGVTADEAVFFFISLINTTIFDGLTDLNANEEKWRLALTSMVDFHSDKPAYSKEDLDKIKKRYFEGINLSDKSQFIRQMIEMSSDATFKSPNDKTVRLISAAGVPVYMYVMDHAPPSKYKIGDNDKRDVPHASDTPYLFDSQIFLDFDMTADEDQKMSNIMVDMWTNFANTHNPTPDGSPLEWLPTPPGEIKYLSISTEPMMKDGYRTEEMQFWHDINFKPTSPKRVQWTQTEL